jgi:hypothetical protein
VWRTVKRGHKPSWIAWRVTEKAPEMTAWLAMIVATVARPTSAGRRIGGAIAKNGFLTVSGSARTSAPWLSTIWARAGSTKNSHESCIGRRPKWPMSA